MNWTSETPTKPGQYWYRWDQQTPIIVELQQRQNGVLHRIYSTSIWKPLRASTLDEWAGPLEAPT